MKINPNMRKIINIALSKLNYIFIASPMTMLYYVKWVWYIEILML